MEVLLMPVLLAVGIGLGYFIRMRMAQIKFGSVEEKVEELLKDAKTKEQEIIHGAKDKAFTVLEDAKKEEENRRKEIQHLQNRLEKRETLFDQKILDLENKQQVLTEKSEKVEALKKEIHKIKEDQMNRLETISALTREDAKSELFTKVEREYRDDLMQRIKKVQDETSEQVTIEAKKTLNNVILRLASSHTAEVSTTNVSLPSDEMKGRIIGREGRNIKTIEQLTGVEIIIDDTPEVITISGFNPIRRHVAKKALEQLILDGRIHPGRIEEAIEQAKREIATDIKKAGEEAALSVGITGLDPKLLQILGRLKYRTSYGQNVLLHSIEVANLSAMLASELGGNPNIAKKAGLLHDIGKALDHEIPGTHTEIGRDIGKKFNLSPEIIAPIYEHHDDMPSTFEGIIVKTTDAISSSRPGARNASQDVYIQRLTELENLACEFPAVEKAYAIQAGREVRIFVNPENINDLECMKLAKDVAGKIESELKYPGEIKVNLIREKRVIEYAR